MDVVCGGGLGLNKEAARPLWRSIRDVGDGTVLLVRSSQPPLRAVSKVKEQAIDFATGEVRKFNCRLNLSTRVWVDQPWLGNEQEKDRKKCRKKVEKSLDPEAVEPWLRHMLSQNGMALQSAAVVSQNRRLMKRSHFINGADILFVVRITDPALAKVAYLRGIGRKKAFGFGLLLESE